MRRNLAPGCISSDVNLCQRKPLFPFFGDPFFLGLFFFFLHFLFFLSPAKVGSLEMQPGAKLQAYLGVIILQPHACTQRFRLRILRRTRLNAGRTSAGSLSGRIESIWETPSKERGPKFGAAARPRFWARASLASASSDAKTFTCPGQPTPQRCAHSDRNQRQKSYMPPRTRRAKSNTLFLWFSAA